MCITATLLRPSSLWMVLRGGCIKGFGGLVGVKLAGIIRQIGSGHIPFVC
jgi:hypothetical protein